MAADSPPLQPTPDPSAEAPPAPVPDRVRRHRLSTRLWHWTSVLCVYVLFTSGLGIFNAHPRLYWGHYGANADHAWLERAPFDSLWTLPAHYDLALSRRWHLAFALILAFALLAYMLWSLFNRHIARDLAFHRRELRPAAIWREIKDHARLRFPGGAAALRYNVLQKASYIGVIFILLPLLIFTGLTMSPGMDAAWPWLVDLFGGRQSARSIHFLCAWALALFVAVHLLMVLLAGPLNLLGAMLSGWYRVPRERAPEPRP